MSTPIDLVLVGYRPGALHAAARLGLNVLLVEEKKPSRGAGRRIVDWVRVALEGAQEELIERTLARLSGNVPRGVVSAGERGVLGAAALRAALGIQGIDPETAFRARDKPTMKAAARAAGVPCADWLELGADTTADDLVAAVGVPLVLKHRAGAGTRGLLVAKTAEEAGACLASIDPEERGGWMAERFLRGVEMSIESFVANGRILFTNPTEYYRVGFANIAPAALAPNALAAVEDLNARAVAALGITRGMTHLELYQTPDGPIFGEVAVRPPGGRIMRLLRRAYHFDPWDVVVRLELGEAPDIPPDSRRAAGVWMLHPGAGRVRSIRGLGTARRVLGVRKLVCRLRTGRTLRPRASTGSDVGWIEVWGKNRDQVAKRLQRAYDHVDIRMEPTD